ncbi:phage protein NinX family protein [Klebsiella quasipneumoniae]|uniref:phage protein NinX family protein n=1 Tax=Klebsiella quasipneumoniae TaxID=1463165 RepID=UPI00352BCB96
MTDYSKMSDFEINLRVAEIVVDYDCISRLPYTDMAVHWGDGANWHVFNPCNNPADAWPIIIDNQLSLNNYGDSWEASFEHDEPVGAFGTDECVTSGIEDKNPLRALMIAFLMKVEIEYAKIPSERDS